VHCPPPVVCFLCSSIYTKSFIIVFITVITFLAFDFWTVKNVSGRLLVGLRWWNKVGRAPLNPVLTLLPRA
jgi:hypothetical protein